MAKGVLKVRVMGDESHLKKTLSNSESMVGKFGSAVGKAGLALGAMGVAAGVAAAGGFIKLMGPVGELQAKMAKANTVFGESMPIVETWASKTAGAMGMSSKAATGLAANFADLLIPMGFTRKEAADMSTQVVGLSGALSSWTNGTRTAAEVSDILAKAMLGEREGLKELGISISDADVKARLLANGTDKLKGAQLQQAIATATQQLIFEKSADAQTAFADKTQTIYEKQLKLRGMIDEVKDKILTALIPVYEKVLSWTLEHWPTIQRVIETAFEKAGAAMKWIKEEIIDGILIPAFNRVKQWGSDNEGKLREVWEKVKGAFSDLGAAVKTIWNEGIVPAWNALALWVSQHKEELRAIWAKASEAMSGLKDAVVTGWPLIKTAVATAWPGISDALGKMIWALDKILGAVNAVISAYNRLAGVESNYDRNHRAPAGSPGGARGGHPGTAPTSPGGGARPRAEGGLITRPEIALLGEAGPELVVPLSRPGAGLKGLGLGATVYNINVNVGGSVISEGQLVRAVINGIRKQQLVNGAVFS